jgi:hypothetical protein
MEERKLKLEEEVRELMEWMRSIQAQQIPFPMDSITEKIAHENNFVVQPEFLIIGNTNIALGVNTDRGLFYMPVITDELIIVP